MLSLKPKQFKGGVELGTFTSLFGILLLACVVVEGRVSKQTAIVLSAFVFILVLIHVWKKRCYSGNRKKFLQILSKHAKIYLACALLTVGAMLVLRTPAQIAGRMLNGLVALPVIGMFAHFLSDAGREKRVAAKKKKVKHALVAGTGSMASFVEQQIYRQRTPAYTVKGFISCLSKEECIVPKERVVGSLDDIRSYLQENPVDEIVIALPGKPRRKIQNIIETADYFGIRVKYIPDYMDLFGKDYRLTRFGTIEAVNIHRIPIDGKLQKFLKDGFDLVFSTITLMILLPLFLLVAVAIKVDSPGPVFYCPVRIGKSGRAFKVFKFRSMKGNDASAGGVLSTQKNDPRITRVGKFLRKYSIDELPQFINVFIGNMSVVGPRPHRQLLDKQLQESVYKYMIRHYVKPGITGWAQVNGWRGPTDTAEQKRQRTLHDLWYLENWSFWLDLKIIWMTIFSRKAHQNAF